MTSEDEPRPGDDIQGEPGDGPRLVPIGRGIWAWVDAGAVAEWDERAWRPLGVGGERRVVDGNVRVAE